MKKRKPIKPNIVFSTSVFSRKEVNDMLKEADPNGELKKLGLKIICKKPKK